MATRTTTTRVIRTVPALSAGQGACCYAGFSFDDLFQAYLDCRKTKRNKPSAIAFEKNVDGNLRDLYAGLVAGTYRPGRSICFIITRPKPREVWAADFRDRVVHHLLHNKLSPRFYAAFIADSCACIPGRGTLYAAKRLEAKIRSASENWSKPLWYLKCDLANFFVSIDKDVLWNLIQKRVPEPWWRDLAHTILFHDPRENFEMRGAPYLQRLVPAHKQLGSQPRHLGLPIGNLSSQFFANIYLDALDQHVKHRVGARHYIRYVDDFILLHESPQWLNAALVDINAFLPRVLHAHLNPTKTILQPVTRGVDFVGQVIKPWHSRTRRRTFHEALNRIRTIDDDCVYRSSNSYFGLLRQSSKSHAGRAKLADTVLQRGYSVNKQFTKTFRKSA